ncbi:MAG: pyruvate carboxylase subunit A [Desulfurococcales archaeon ex4484_58]|nr:MAG: pyruvate carboxylase subunit A [Desulfurococcales archaeon ex4484_58]
MPVKILIANRGEIAVRIARSIRELGFIPLGIYSDEDKDSLHRSYMDEDYKVSSYLSIDDIIEAAENLGADAIHPGYGFLSENPLFAKRVVDKGFIFIGPRPEVMVLAGDKVEAKKKASEAEVPTLPWIIAGKPEDIVEFAREHGYPVMIKAAGGGGGMGIRIVRNDDEVYSLYEQARKEAENAFNDPRLYVEPYIERAKHIEVQILGDGENIIHLYERDCSVQRRHQKIVEEAPAPTLTSERRRKILNDAVKLMKYIKYSNAGTVEMIYDMKRRKHYFMEINARLQVEHGITEMITGIDIVKQQILIALNNSLDLRQEDIVMHGHSIEVRINAENPITLMPSPGIISEYREPSGPGIRVDSGVSRGQLVSVEYTPLISKLIVWGINRAEAIRRLERALNEYLITGIQTNIPLLKAIIKHPIFRKGYYTTSFINNNWEDLVSDIRRREMLHTALLLAIVHRGDDKVKSKIISSSKYTMYSNGLTDTRMSAIKRKAWVYWITLRRRVSRHGRK